MPIRVLVADDDSLLRGLLIDILNKERYLPIEASDGIQAIDLFFTIPDIALVILDVMMPGYNGWEVLQKIREHSDVPVIMLTALGTENYEVKGLRAGADDYIAKPFSYEVFVARLNAAVRKLRIEQTAELRMGKIIINQALQQVIVEGTNIGLNRKEYSLMRYLVLNKGQILTREQIINHVWGYDFDGDIRTLDTHIKTLRAKLGTCSAHIKTARGTGYLFISEGTN